MILLWNENHFVIIESIKNNKATIIDPALGKVEVNRDEFSSKFSNIVIMMEPNENFKTNKKSVDLNKYLNLIHGYYKYIAYIVIVSFLVQCLTLFIPIMTKNIMDMNINEYGFEITTFAIIIGVLTLQSILNYFKDFLIVNLQSNMDYNLMYKFINHMLYLPYKFFQLRSKGDIIQRLNSNLIIREIISQKFITTIINMILLFVIAIYMYTQSKLISFINIFIGISLFVIVLLSKKKNSLLINKQIISQSNTSSLVTESLEGISNY